MSVLNATAADPAANSYVDLDGANAYFTDRVAQAKWAAATDDEKRRALIQATRELDAYVQWMGIATTTTQALAFPRMGLVDPDTNRLLDDRAIPNRLVWATCEQAAAILAGDRASAENAAQVARLSKLVAGPVELEFAGGTAPARPTLIPSAFQFIACWGRQAQATLGGNVPLLRA